jgi:DNA-binding NarL/FixJ family response regulator
LLIQHRIDLKHGLKEVLESVPHVAVIGTTALPSELAALCRTARWDVVLLNYSQSADFGFEVIRSFRQERPELRLIVIGPALQPDHICRYLNLGIRGYLAAEDVPEQIGSAVAAVLAGAVFLSRAAARCLGR